MKFIKTLLYIIIALLAVILLIALFLPKEVSIDSTAKIGLRSEKIFQMLATYSNRAEWDPWVATDSTAKVTIEKADGYIGSKYSWNGTKIGRGQEVIDSVGFGKHIRSNIRFGDEKTSSVNTWDFSPENDSTLVKWGFTTQGSYPFGRIALPLMKKQLKLYFDKGLMNLKTYLEKNGFLLSTLTGFELADQSPMQAMGVKTKIKMSDIQKVMAESLNNLMSSVVAENLTVSGPPFTYYFDYNQQANETGMIVGIPVVKTGKGNENVTALKFPAMKVLKAVHTGPYDEIGISYEKLNKYAADNNIKLKWESWEIYLTDPSKEANPLRWRTIIAFTVE